MQVRIHVSLNCSTLKRVKQSETWRVSLVFVMVTDDAEQIPISDKVIRCYGYLIYEIAWVIHQLIINWAKHWLLFVASINTLRPRQDDRHFPGDIFKCIFLNKSVWILIEISLKFVLKDPIDNIPALVPIMALRRSGDKPLSETMTV